MEGQKEDSCTSSRTLLRGSMIQPLAIAILIAVACFILFRIAAAMVSLAWKLFLSGLVMVTLIAAGGISWWLVSA